MRETVGFLQYFTTLFNSSLKPKTAIKSGDISVDTFQKDTNCNRKFSSFNLSMQLTARHHCFICSNEVNLINFSLNQRINNFIDIKFCLAQTQKATSKMMNSFNNLVIKIDEFSIIVTFEGIFNPCNTLNMIDILQNNGQLTNHCIDARAYTTQADNICSNLSRKKELTCSWASSHIFLLELQCVGRGELTLLNYKLPWRNKSLYSQKWFLLLLFYGFRQQIVWMRLKFSQLQVYNQIINSTNFTQQRIHKLQLFHKRVLHFIIDQFNASPCFVFFNNLQVLSAFYQIYFRPFFVNKLIQAQILAQCVRSLYRSLLFFL